MRFFDIACTGCVLVAAAALGAGDSLGANLILRVMTFNIRYGTARDGENSWDARQQLLLKTIRKFNPDLLGTQEVLAAQADYLVENLKDYTLLGVGREDGKRRGEFSALLFKSKRFQPVASGTFWLSETPGEPGSKSWDSSLPRIATWVKLGDRANGGRQICFLNTHWDHRGRRARVEAGKLIRTWLNENARGMPVIVTGDLNVTEGHEGLRALVATDGNGPHLSDVYRLVHPQPAPEEATSHGFSGRRRGRRIDFILASPEWSPTEATIDHTNEVGHYPSDHYPVTVVLQSVP